MKKYKTTALLLASLSFGFAHAANAADKRGLLKLNAAQVQQGSNGAGNPVRPQFQSQGRPSIGSPSLGQPGKINNQQGNFRPGNVNVQPQGQGKLPDFSQKPNINKPINLPRVTGNANAGKIDLGKVNNGRPDFGKVNGGKVDFGKVDLGKANGGKVDLGKVSNGRPDLGKVNNGKLDLGKVPAGKVDLGKINAGKLDLGKVGPGKIDLGNVKKISHDLPKLNLADRLKAGDFNKIGDSKIGKQIDLSKQLDLHKKGDIARQLNLSEALLKSGGWHKRFCGVVDPFYSKHCFGHFYCGGGWFPSYCWFPTWTPWVDWCWHYPCVPVCDPRPIFCRPIYCDPCVPWIVWDYPVWTPMPVVVCGTWVDVQPIVISQGLDIQLLAVRFVDPGHPEKELGPRYRVWVRNNSPVAVADFNILTYASNERLPAMGMPEAGVRVPSLAAGQIQSFDVRLPFTASTLDRDEVGRKVPFKFLHVVADSHREIPEAFEENNGAVLDRRDILSVDPALLGVELSQNELGPVVNVAGEGFGPEPGQVLVSVNGVQLQGEITGWYDLGVQIKLPRMSFVSDVKADLIVVRGDKAASNPMPVSIVASAEITSTVPVATPAL